MAPCKLRFDVALLPTGWSTDVLVVVDASGFITAVEPDCNRGRHDGERHEGERTTGVAIPGVPNVHSHAHQRAMAGLAEHAAPDSRRQKDSFWTWRELMYRFVRRMTPEDLEAIAAQLYVEMLEAGFTAVGEFQYLHHDLDGTPYADPAEMTLRCLSAARETGIGFTALPVLYAYGGFGGRPPTDGQRRFLNDGDRFFGIVETLHGRLADDPNGSLGVAPHSLRAVSPELLRDATVALSTLEPEAPIHLHIAEQTGEVDDCLEWSDARPVDWLLDHFDVSARWCLIHATHMTPDEARRLAKTGATVGLCPTTEANLGDGIFPGPSYFGSGGSVAIGSDSHITISPAEDLRMLEYSQRLRDRARNVLNDGPGCSTGRGLLERTLAGGSRALARPIGAIAPGYRADIVRLDPDHRALIGRGGDALLDSWIFSSGNSCVADVWVGGEHVVKDGHHIHAEAIETRFRTAIERLQTS